MASAIVFLVFACALLPLLAAAAGSQVCVFPFIFRNMSYTSCTSDGTSDGRLWCAVTPNYDKDRKWKACITEEYGGNSDGQPCVFPFIYLRKKYFTCTSKNSHKAWCATTSNYDKDKKWSFCADPRLRGDPCAIPFEYNNTIYQGCTTDDSPNGKPWCSQTKNYDVDRKRVFCEASAPEQKPICVFPFVFNGKIYTTCTEAGSFFKDLWCSLTNNYDEHKKWKRCQSSDLEKACHQKS